MSQSENCCIHTSCEICLEQMELKASDLRFKSGTAALVADVNEATLRAWKRQGWFVPVAALFDQVRPGKRVPYQLGDVIVLRVMVVLIQAGLSPSMAWQAVRLEVGNIIAGGRWLVLPRMVAREHGVPTETGLRARVLTSEADAETVLKAARGVAGFVADLSVSVDLEKIRSDGEHDLVKTWTSLVRLGENPQFSEEGE